MAVTSYPELRKFRAQGGKNVPLNMVVGGQGRWTQIFFATIHFSEVVVGPITVTISVGSQAGGGLFGPVELIAFSIASNQDAVWSPDFDMVLAPDDTLIVNVPAGGAGISAGIEIRGAYLSDPVSNLRERTGGYIVTAPA